MRIWEPFDPSKHDERYKYKRKNGVLVCHSVFSKLIEIDQLVTVGENQHEMMGSFDSEDEKGDLSLYCSTSKNPKYIDDDGCSFIGNILSVGDMFIPKENINVQMRFGETEIEINAQQLNTLTGTYYLGQ
jgi:hypothetical protein